MQCKSPTANSHMMSVCVASFPGLPPFFFVVICQYILNANRITKKGGGLHGNEAIVSAVTKILVRADQNWQPKLVPPPAKNGLYARAAFTSILEAQQQTSARCSK